MKAIIKLSIALCVLTAKSMFTAFAAPYYPTKTLTDSTVVYKVLGNCGMCKTRIENAAKSKGVSSANWDMQTQKLTLTVNPGIVDLQNVKQQVANVGHDIDDLRADDAVYAKLHECCLYDREPIAASNAQGNTQFTVLGACGMCKRRIENIAKTHGAAEANWEVKTQLLTLPANTSEASISRIKQEILAAGHDVDGITANQDAYKKLPDCCRYHDEDNPHNFVGAESEGKVSGVVMEEDERGNLSPIRSVNITWMEDPKTSTQTDGNGVFRINHRDGLKRLIVSFAGYESDTVAIRDPNEVLMFRAKNNVLEEVTITARRSTNYISAIAPLRLEVITGAELFKAACCNLAESFETNASVDVVSSDAVTGAKQIQLLGLSGSYTQLMVENLPGPRGLASPLGLNSIAGTWIESIQISKGIGSVVNGFENITGQINVELKKPENSERIFFNAYGNDMGRTDINLNLAHRFSEKWSGSLLLHDNFMYNKHLNFSNNGFRDLPVGNLFSGVNRWKYENGKGLMVQFGAKYLKDDRIGGQIDFDPNTDKFGSNRYGVGINLERYEVFGKIGYVFPQNVHRSLGLQLSGSIFDQNSYFGQRAYDASQEQGYANLIYQDILGTVNHKYRAGLSVQVDKYDEAFMDQRFGRTETVPGAFVEYTFSPSQKFDAVLGLRGDYNNLYGWFATPRMNLRYQPATGSTLRFSAGRGQRTANIFAENTAALASSRVVNIRTDNTHRGAYGLNPEIAWTTGLSFDQSFKIWNRDASFSTEFFRNSFENQIVVDYENPRELSFYNLDGKSYSNSLQTEFRFMPLPRLEMRTAYRFFDVKTTYGGELLDRPLVAKHRGFANLGYNTATGGWHFDYTLNITGSKRLPSTTDNPVQYQLEQHAPSFITMNAQVSKTFGKIRPFDLYIGGENLTNLYQKDPILAADQPFSPYFDSSMVWGPLAGRMFYAGIRFGIK